MKRHIWVAIALSLALGLMGMGRAALGFAQEVTIVGEIADWNGSKKEAKNKGAAHRACAINCAKTGAPLGIVEEINWPGSPGRPTRTRS